MSAESGAPDEEKNGFNKTTSICLGLLIPALTDSRNLWYDQGMPDIDANQEKFRQQDINVSHEAAEDLEHAVTDKESPIGPEIFKKEHEAQLTAFLDAAERKIKRGKLDGLLKDFGVYDRDTLEDSAITEALKMRGGRTGAAQGILVIEVDVDLLKRVNDALGHLAGDELIVSVAGALRRVLRATDLIGRFGGDEIVSLLSVPDEKIADIIMTVGRFDQDGSARPAIFSGLKEALEASREQFKRAYGERWPNGTENKKPGQASIGWHFFSRQDYLKRFDEYLQSKQEGKSFIAMLLKEADQKLYEMKETPKTSSPDTSPETSISVPPTE